MPQNTIVRRSLLAVVALVGAVAVVVPVMLFMTGASGRQADARPLPAPSSCDLYAAPDGSDSGPGTRDRPFATVQHLLDRLSAGRTGCVEDGEYDEDIIVHTSGTKGAPLTLRGVGERSATVRGRIVVPDGVSDVTIRGLSLDGRNDDELPSPTVNGDRITFADNDVTNHHETICFSLGHPQYGTAEETKIMDNRIHDCGQEPSTNYDHGIYVNTALDTLIVRNEIVDNADRGVQLYPDAQNTRILDNVIDSNGTGVIFSGADGTVSEGNLVEGNLITNSRRYNVESFWAQDEVGQGNVVEDNCLWGGGEGDIGPEVGFTARNNVIADPDYVSADRGDYRLGPDSPCSRLQSR